MSQPETVVGVLRASAEAGADDEAYLEYDAEGLSRHSLTFGALDAAADAVAALLAERGVKKGDVVALVLPSSIDYAVCYHAALRLGAVTSGVNPRLGRAERTSIFNRLGAVVTVAESRDPALAEERGRVIDRSEVSAAVS